MYRSSISGGKVKKITSDETLAIALDEIALNRQIPIEIVELETEKSHTFKSAATKMTAKAVVSSKQNTTSPDHPLSRSDSTNKSFSQPPVSPLQYSSNQQVQVSSSKS